MPRASNQSKRRRPNSPETNRHTDSIDLSSDSAFLTPHETYGNTNVLLHLLITGRITNSSFSNLYNRSKQTNWKQVLIEERNNLNPDEKTKSKRFMFNRLIVEYSKNEEEFNEQVETLNEQIKNHMSDVIPPELTPACSSEDVNKLYAEIESWRELQSDRSLFLKERDQLHSLLSLQQILTDHFMNLVKNSSDFEELSVQNDLKELLRHSLIIVAHPSSSECVAMTKYEKVGKDYFAKIKTRIICLINPIILERYLKLSDVDVTLYPMNREIDKEGDIQSSLKWKTRTVISNENHKWTFVYAELSEKESIELTKMNPARKLLYNQQLCELEFRTTIELIGTNIEEILVMKSEPFGVCSHAKYFPKYLANIFIKKVNQMYSQVILETHVNTLKGYICEFYRRVSGVATKLHTEQFIDNELQKVYDSFQETSNLPDGPVLIFSLNIYKDILEKLFIQIKFLANHPFLSMMYHESLFLGICDMMINQGTEERPLALLRFEKQEKKQYPKIIFAIYNGELRKARINHGSFIGDMCRCFCEAADNTTNRTQLFDSNENLPFQNLNWYYDEDLSQSNVSQDKDGTNFYSLKFLLRDAMRTNRDNQLAVLPPNSSDPTTSHNQSQSLSQMLNNQYNVMDTFTLQGQIFGSNDLAADAITSLRESFLQWCTLHNVHGCLTQMALTELSYNNDISPPMDTMLFDDDLDTFL